MFLHAICDVGSLLPGDVYGDVLPFGICATEIVHSGKRGISRYLREVQCVEIVIRRNLVDAFKTRAEVGVSLEA